MEAKLSSLKKGDSATIKEFDCGVGIKKKMNSLGLQSGKKFLVISRHPLKGPMILRIGSVEIALGWGMADQIIVQV